ncbi:unnamed protein product [Polarella glacialis]|uniref:Sodium/calcium exchanger membrane region domain-containing protein n=1 Tax=Polarella glacialis TaxID=89957 RepID=A0A813EZU1_POLGL|nr:unnamed protein product [Polarella glacialis]CAE8662840.1 unnamed protein product [Polarella glacialis]
MTARMLVGDDIAQSEDETPRFDTVGVLKGWCLNPIAYLLVCVPAAIALSFQEVEPVWIFSLNFCSIIPLAWLISEATEHLETITGPTIGVLLNSTFGNVVEIILSVQAIRAGLVKVVQSSLLGAMVMNLLFVTGCCFFITGLKKSQTNYNTHNVSYNLSLLSVACLALIVPTELASTDEWSSSSELFSMSRFVAVLLAAMYVLWLVFNLSTHAHLFQTEVVSKQKVHLQQGASPILHTPQEGRSDSEDDPEEEDEGPRLSCGVATALLLVCTVLVSFHCDWLVESIEPVTKSLKIKEAFVATVLLPMVGNFSEIIAAVSIASKGKLDLAMGVAIGSATQIALLVVPIAVWIGYFMGQPFDLDFEVFQVRLLVVCLLMASFCLLDGTANWLKGAMMMIAYVIVATAFYWLHDREFQSAGRAPASADELASVIKSLQAQLAQVKDVLHLK